MEGEALTQEVQNRSRDHSQLLRSKQVGDDKWATTFDIWPLRSDSLHMGSLTWVGRPWHFIATSLWRNVLFLKRTKKWSTANQSFALYWCDAFFLTYLSFNIFTRLIPQHYKLFICDFYGLVTFAPLRSLMDPSGSGQNPALFVVCSLLLKKKGQMSLWPNAKVSCFSQWSPPLCLGNIGFISDRCFEWTIPPSICPWVPIFAITRWFLSTHSAFLTCTAAKRYLVCGLAVLCTWCQAGRVAKQPFVSYLGLFKWQPIRADLKVSKVMRPGCEYEEKTLLLHVCVILDCLSYMSKFSAVCLMLIFMCSI